MGFIGQVHTKIFPVENYITTFLTWYSWVYKKA